jgi:hypothetical protein
LSISRKVKSLSLPANSARQAGGQARLRGYFPHRWPSWFDTANHVSVVVQEEETAFFLAGDTSYNERLMLAGKVDGVSADEHVSSATLGAIKSFAQSRPMVYLPTHDPQSADRLANRSLVGTLERTVPQAA